MLQTVIFDFDGVLSPTSLRQEKWFRSYALTHSVSWPFSTFDDFLSFYNDHCARQGGVQNVYDALGLPCEMTNRQHPVWPAYEFFNQQNPTGLYDGMAETIREIWELGALGKDPLQNRRLRLAINTNNSWATVYSELSRSGIISYFDAHITEEVLRAYHGLEGDCMKKPASISLALLLGLLNSEEEYTLHVGDTRNDLRASQKIVRLNPRRPEKVITVGACYGYEGRAMLEKGVDISPTERAYFDHLIDQPRELVGIVKSYLST